MKSEFKKKRYPIIHTSYQPRDKLTKQGQDIIINLINGPLKRVEISNNLEVTRGSISKQLVNLQDNVLIELNDENKYQLCDEILGLLLKNEYKIKGVYPYRRI